MPRFSNGVRASIHFEHHAARRTAEKARPAAIVEDAGFHVAALCREALIRVAHGVEAWQFEAHVEGLGSRRRVAACMFDHHVVAGALEDKRLVPRSRYGESQIAFEEGRCCGGIGRGEAQVIELHGLNHVIHRRSVMVWRRPCEVPPEDFRI